MPRRAWNSLSRKERLANDVCFCIMESIALKSTAPLRGHKPERNSVLHENSLIFVTVANLIPYKGHLDLIAAFGGIREQLPANWKLLLVGRDDGILPDVMRSAQNYGLDSNIQWLGQRSDVPTILRAADIGVMASHEEGMPNSLLEGMAASLPMVATSVGGVVDIISDGVDGLLAPKQNPATLGAAILRLVQDADLRSKLGCAARRTVEERFSIEIKRR